MGYTQLELRDSSLAVFFQAPRQVSVQQTVVPKPGPGEVWVDSLLSAISPGTEMLIYRGEAPENLPADELISSLASGLHYPLKYGYSVVGRIGELGSGVDKGWQHRNVFAFHPHESSFLADPADLIPLPEDVDVEDALFLPNMETAVSFLMDGQPLIGERVAVFGQGIVGLLTTTLLAGLPLAELRTVDRFQMRRERSLDLGATASREPGRALDLGEASQGERKNSAERQGDRFKEGFDLVYELSGSPKALDEAIAVCGMGSRVIVGSWYGNKRVSLNLGGHFHRDHIRLISSQVSNLAPRWRARWTKGRRLGVAWEMIRRHRPSRLITHRLPIKDAAAAYELLDQRPAEAIQVVLKHSD